MVNGLRYLVGAPFFVAMAVFGPIGEVGLIVADEEHDGSYKHEGDPRYDARDYPYERRRGRPPPSSGLCCGRRERESEFGRFPPSAR